MGDILDGTSKTLLIGEIGESLNVTPGSVSRGYALWIGDCPDGNYLHPDWGGTARLAAADHPINCAVTDWKSNDSFGSYHRGGAQFVFCDGSVRFLPEAINAATYANLANRNDGQAISNMPE